MSEQAEVKSPTVAEESEPEAISPPAPESVGANGPEPAADSASETQASEATSAEPTEAASEEVSPEPQAAADEPEAAEPASAEPASTEPASTESASLEAAPEEPAAAEPVKAEEAEAPSTTSETAELEPEPAAKAEPEAESATKAETEVEPAAKAETEAETKTEAAPAAETPPPKEPKPLTEEEKARLAEIEGLRQAKEENRPVTGRVIGWNQGGFHVVIGTITTFCPRSEMELKNPKSPNFYLDQELDFYVIKHQKKGKRIVVSRKQLLEQEREKILASMKDTLVPGADLDGKVSSLTDFGAFVDLGGGIEGLVHLTELSNRRVKHPKDLVELGKEVKVRVLKVEQDGQRISLSMKALEPNPYAEFAEDHPRGAKFKGKVVRKTDFGAFVELLPGLDGMIHLSQLPPGTTLDDEALEVGKEIEGWVLRVEPKRERISLSLKEIPTDDPWKGILERYPEGSLVEGEVEDVAPFGVFIQLEPGLTGLLPNSEMSLPRGQDRSKHYPPGKKVEIQVASVDPQRKRISLVPQGAQIEGSRSDYRDYLKQQRKQGEGMTAMAAAFAKLKDQTQDEA